MSEHFDNLESRESERRDADLFEALRGQIRHAQANSPHYAQSLAGVDADAIIDRKALAALPVLRKSDLIKAQEDTPPFGGVATSEAGAMRRLFLSPGPIAEPQGGEDPWRMARALWAAGLRKGDVAHSCFSYHLTPAGFMFDVAARQIGCAVFPGGVGNTEQQIDAMRRLKPNAYVGTPDFLRIIMEKAEAQGAPIESIRKAMVSAGPLFPDLRAWYEERGVRCRQCYATADLGLIAYEVDDPAEGMVLDENCLVEILRPGTGDPVSEGEVGEVVVSGFDPHYPLIRFATGDLSAIMPGQTSCGRSNARIKGWMGRADQTTKVRGMFVHPEQIARVIKAFGIEKARLEVTEAQGKDSMRLICEGSSDAAAVAEALRAQTRIRGEVDFVAPGALPNDGKVIDDKRGV